MGGIFIDGKFILSIIFSLWRMCLAKETPANFVFGDSLVEVGNNNYIPSLSKADYPPNGIDFGKPTGRYTNARTVIDIIGQSALGLKEFTPPYLAPTTAGPVILRGVNYASGGGGILNETGKIYVGRINMDAQIDNFANTRQDIISSIGLPAAVELLRRALFSVTIGSNDFLSNYLVPVITEVKRKLIPPETFVGILIARFRLQLTRLYNLGARRMVVINLGPIGCIPFEREVNLVADPEKCAEFPNQLARSFNAKLRTLVTELNKNLPGAKFVYANVHSIVEDIIENYISYGFENTNSACCSVVGRYGGLIACGPQPSMVCEDRSKYVFWDPYHPSDASNMIIARRLLYGNSSDISPMNIVQLLQAS
ncbi:putative triacylglycerol lipase [Rosa chinensis]|uniref:Putative triacylglycerol lipase n=1 Tax=Rosa chinensis TaxID=74649 RepID=A0A2P6QZ59_ROSCH|nr:GDSL esterase/lipase At4g16230 isoform X1 [Rosa chinensis]PRQ39461.1 putative triacylglycerol lipase [Rosa chinensis]